MDIKISRIFVAYLILFIAVATTIATIQAKAETIQQEEEPVQEIIQDKKQVEPIVQPQQQPKLINEGYTQTLTKSSGVNYYNGLKETYYSSRVMRHKDIGEWWCDSNGFWRTQEGYFVVAYTMNKPVGTIIDISMGKAMILDHCPTSGAVDIYTNW